MTAIAVLPVKRIGQAKQRLQPDLPAALRQELARAMVGDVLVALRDVRGISATVVVTGEPAVAAAARYVGATVVDDPEDAGQSAAAAAGVAAALAAGATRALLVPGDCPALDPRELDALLELPAGDRDVVIMPDRHGSGTNGLLLTPPGVIAPAFGPGSRERHESLAAAAGAPHRVHELPSLLIDVDTGEDLEELRSRLGADDGRARRTREVLAAAGRPAAA